MVKFTPHPSDLYFANTTKINVSTLKTNLIILFTRQVQEKLLESNQR